MRTIKRLIQLFWGAKKLGTNVLLLKLMFEGGAIRANTLFSATAYFPQGEVSQGDALTV